MLQLPKQKPEERSSAHKNELTELLLSYESGSNPVFELLSRRKGADQPANEGFSIEKLELLSHLVGFHRREI